jgi:cation-transporting ATPase E
VLTAGGGVAVYAALYTRVASAFADNHVPAQVVADFEGYTGLAKGDPGFTDAAATIGAQTGLSTFVSIASIVLILFLAPPTRLFAAWTRPTGDKRPAVLVAGLLAVLVGALFTPAVSDYFGLTGAAPPVYTTVLPVLAVWFVLLAAAYRFRVLDRLLGLRHLPSAPR